MNQDYTDISIVQDKSGSMSPLREDTIKGFNSFIADQKTLPGKCLVTMMQFDTAFFMLYSGEDIQKVQPLTHETYKPDGSTALLDAIAQTIITTGHRLEALSESERPARVVVVIITDGEENSSKEYEGEKGRSKIFEMIRLQTEIYKWSFIFLGANQDAIMAGERIGIAKTHSLSYASTSKGTSSAYAAVHKNIVKYRESANAEEADKALSFNDKQRKEQRQAGAVIDSLNDPDDKKF
jgi:hypothetical protein